VAEAPLDFFSTLHRAVWAALQDYQPFTELVAVRNRVDMTDDEFESFPPNATEDGTPELVVIQGGFSQGSFKTSDAGCGRTQTFALLVTSNRLNPREMNRVKEAMLDALLMKGQTLGLTQPVNGNKVIGWSVAGDDVLLAGASEAPGEDRAGQLRSQSIGRVTVTFMKNLPKRSNL
jgi:hypothetical protein